MSRFVVLEGLDGAGTTTQSARLVATLRSRGANVVATREPTDGPVGRVIRQVLRAEAGSPDVHALPWLFAADRADHLWRTVEPALARGEWVVSDRYYHSSLAYQSLTLPLERVHALNADFRVPHVTIFLAVPVDVCLERISGRPEKEIYEERDRLVKIEAAYRRVNDFLRARGEPIVELDGTRPPDEVEAAVRATVGI
jgi:dTMP kinase